MGYSLQRSLREVLILSEESSDELNKWREEILDDISRLKEERTIILGEIDLPDKIGQLKDDLKGLKKKKEALVLELEALEIKKAKDAELKITGELKKLVDKERKYRETIEELKKEIKDVAEEKRSAVIDREISDKLFRETVYAHNNELESLKKEIAEAKSELDVVLKNTKMERTIIEQERTAFNEGVRTLRDDREAFGKDIRIFNDKKTAFDFEAVAGRAEILEEKAEVARMKNIMGDKVLNVDTLKAGIEAREQEMKDEKIELRAWRDRLEKKEALMLQREKDLDTNWTIFEQSKMKAR